MLLSVLRDASMSGGEKILYILIMVFCVFLSLSVHEMSHGLAANLMGDKTAKNMGRLSLNPLHHIDPFGALCLFLFGFGWAKPVPVNPWNFNNKKGGMALTAFAGPLSNLIVGFVAYLGAFLIKDVKISDISLLNNIAMVSFIICRYLTLMNIGLAVFNLIPFPPLDGSKIVGAILPQRLYFRYMELERYGFIILIILLNVPFFESILSRCQFAILNFYDLIISLFV